MKCHSLFSVMSLGALLSLASMARAQTSQTAPVAPKVVKPSECIADAKSAAASLEHGGKTYYFNSQACKDEFLTDPERYSQLYDALLELKAQGKRLEKPKPLDNASQVPS